MVKKPITSEMNPGPGFQIRIKTTRPPKEIVNGFAGFATPDISDVMNRLYTMFPEIRSMTPQRPTILGPACTVKLFPGDNLMVHKSLDIAEPGDVVVVDAGASTMNAVLGDLVCTKAKHRGIGGFIVDGLVRDIEGILGVGIPVFARGVTPIGPLHRGPGEVNYPIQCGGIVVHPGDIVIGDMNGVVVVPQAVAADILSQLHTRKQAQAEYVAAVYRGDFSNEWVDRIVTSSGCKVDGEMKPTGENTEMRK